MPILGGARWQRARAELDQALDLTGDERQAWLASLRARAPELAADVEQLLDQHQAPTAADFLQEAHGTPKGTRNGQPTSEATSLLRPALANGARFGPYRIVEPLGHGGMGVVYAADEIESGRRVALKVLSGSRQGKRKREHFLREGRLAASVNHPHSVLDGESIERALDTLSRQRATATRARRAVALAVPLILPVIVV